MTLSFEPLTPAHAPLLFSQLANPSLYSFLPQEPPASVDALADEFRRLQRGPAVGEERWFNWVMRSGGEPVGTLQATVQRGGVAWIAYLVFAEHQRKGYAAAGCRWLIERLFAMDGVDVVRAAIDTRNAASIRLAQAAGLRQAALVREADHFKGGPSDEFVYELSRDGSA